MSGTTTGLVWDECGLDAVEARSRAGERVAWVSDGVIGYAADIGPTRTLADAVADFAATADYGGRTAAEAGVELEARLYEGGERVG